MSYKVVTSTQELIGEVFRDCSSWDKKSIPWFRGEPRDTPNPLLPSLFRKKHDELHLLQHFRMKAPSLGLPYVPPRGYVDQWLFLAQHVRLPTRLLDWTGGLLIALHFALHSSPPGAVVWMLNQEKLNLLSAKNYKGDYTITWLDKRSAPLKFEDLYWIKKIVESNGEYKIEDILAEESLGYINIKLAWTENSRGTKYPVALHPTNIHPRMSSQISRFTIHGEWEIPISEMDLTDGILYKYVIADEAIPSMKHELRTLGITHSSLFPELDGLSDELAEIY